MEDSTIKVAEMLSDTLLTREDVDRLYEIIRLEKTRNLSLDFEGVKEMSDLFMDEYSRCKRQLLDLDAITIIELNVPNAIENSLKKKLAMASDIDVDAETLALIHEAREEMVRAEDYYNNKRYPLAVHYAFSAVMKVLRTYIARHNLIVGNKKALESNILDFLVENLAKNTLNTIDMKSRSGTRFLVIGKDLKEAVSQASNLYHNVSRMENELWRYSLRLPATFGPNVEKQIQDMKSKAEKACNLMLHYGPMNNLRFGDIPKDTRKSLIFVLGKLGLDKKILDDIMNHETVYDVTIERGLDFAISIVKLWDKINKKINKIADAKIRLHPTERRLILTMLPFKHMEILLQLSAYKNWEKFDLSESYNGKPMKDVYEENHLQVWILIDEAKKIEKELEGLALAPAILE